MFSRSAQTARRADPPGPLFHCAIWTAAGAGAGAGSDAGAGIGTGGRSAQGADPDTGGAEIAGPGADPGTGGVETAGPGADPGTGGVETAGPAAGPLLCLPPFKENSPCSAAGLLVPLRR